MDHVNAIRKDVGMENTFDKNSGKEYIYRDPEATSYLVFDTIYLTNARDELIKSFPKGQIIIGRFQACDLCIEDQTLEMQHAEMMFKGNYWFLQDHASTQGTYLNGERLEAGKYYQLLAGDELVFGRAEPVYFEKSERRVWAKDAAKTIPEMEKELRMVMGHTDKTSRNLEKYKILKELSKTMSYSIYTVEDIETKCKYVMKCYDKTQPGYSESMKDGLILEAWMMSDLEHLAIPKLVTLFETDDNVVMFREYVDGISLEQYVREKEIPTAETVIEWAKMTCDILQYLHTMTPPHIYRDVKPANLILDTKGQIHIIDFGIMRTYKEGQSQDTALLGTVGYAAPEQYGSRQTDQRTDIYGLGMTMYRLVTGENVADRNCVVKPVCEINPKLPKGLEYIISKCIELDPDKRYQSCEELLKDLCRYEKLPEQRGFFRKLFGRK